MMQRLWSFLFLACVLLPVLTAPPAIEQVVRARLTSEYGGTVPDWFYTHQYECLGLGRLDRSLGVS